MLPSDTASAMEVECARQYKLSGLVYPVCTKVPLSVRQSLVSRLSRQNGAFWYSDISSSFGGVQVYNNTNSVSWLCLMFNAVLNKCLMDVKNHKLHIASVHYKYLLKSKDIYVSCWKQSDDVGKPLTHWGKKDYRHQQGQMSRQSAIKMTFCN